MTDVYQSDSSAFYLMKEIYWWFDASHSYVMNVTLICTLWEDNPVIVSQI